jgi:pimeloyl-ACP methyl ester carboxylesterase
LFYSYSSNPPLYPQGQEYFRQYQPATLVAGGKNDYIFPGKGAYSYQQDLKDIEFHLLDTGHFALEEEGGTIANYITEFLTQQLQNTTV